MEQRFCKQCSAQIQSGAEVCGNCGAYQYAAQLETPPQPQHRGFMPPPTGLRSHPIHLGPEQQAFPIQPIVVLPVVRPTSSLALISVVLGVPAIILAAFNAIFDVRAALMQGMMPTSFAIVLIVALFCWVPALIALILGLLAKSKIWRSNGQMQGLGLADISIILGSISLVLSLLGVLFFSLALIP